MENPFHTRYSFLNSQQFGMMKVAFMQTQSIQITSNQGALFRPERTLYQHERARKLFQMKASF